MATNLQKLEQLALSLISAPPPSENSRSRWAELVALARSVLSGPPTFGEFLRELLEARGVTVDQLATKLNFEPWTVYKWLEDERVPSRDRTLRDICLALDLTKEEAELLETAHECRVIERSGKNLSEDSVKEITQFLWCRYYDKLIEKMQTMKGKLSGFLPLSYLRWYKYILNYVLISEIFFLILTIVLGLLPQEPDESYDRNTPRIPYTVEYIKSIEPLDNIINPIMMSALQKRYDTRDVALFMTGITIGSGFNRTYYVYIDDDRDEIHVAHTGHIVSRGLFGRARTLRSGLSVSDIENNGRFGSLRNTKSEIEYRDIVERIILRVQEQTIPVRFPPTYDQTRWFVETR